MSFQVFVALATQWRVIAGMDFVSYEGVEYTATLATVQLMGIPAEKWPDIFDDLRLMERVAKNIFNEKNP